MDTALPQWKLRLAVLAAGIVLASIPVFGLDRNAGLSWIPQVLTIALFLFVAPDFFSAGTDLRLPISLIFLLGWVLVGGVASLIHPTLDPDSEAYKTVVKVVIMTIMYSYVIKDKRDVEVMLWLFLASFPVVLYMNADALQGYANTTYKVFTEEDRFEGTLGNPNEAGWYALMIAWAVVTLIMISKSKLKWITLATIPAVVWIILLSGSRKAFLGIPMFMASWWWFGMRRTSRSSIFMRGVTLFAMVFLIWASMELITSTQQGERLELLFQGKTEASADTRMDMAEAGMKIFAMSPIIGVGFDNYRAVASLSGWSVKDYSHSTVIEVLSDTGIAGFITYFGALALLGLLFYHASDAERTGPSSRVFQLMLCLWVLFIWYNIFSVQFSERIIWPIIGAMAGFAFRATHPARKTAEEPEAAPQPSMPKLNAYWPADGE